MTAYQPKSGMSAYYGADNPSGFITGVDLSQYQPKSAMTAYQPSGNYLTQNDVSGKVDSSSLGTAAWGDNQRWVSSIEGTALVADSARSAGSATKASTCDSATTATCDSQGHVIFKSYIPTSESSKYLQSGDVTGYQPTSAMSAYQETGAMTGYATTALLESGLSGKMDATAGMTVTSTGSAGTQYTPYIAQINGSSLSAHVSYWASTATSASAAVSASTARTALYLSGVPRSSIVQYSAISGNGTAITGIGGSAILGGTEWVSGQFGEYNYVSSNLGIIGGKSGLMSATSEVFNPDGTATGSASASVSTLDWANRYGTTTFFSATDMSSTAVDTQEVALRIYFTDQPTGLINVYMGGRAWSYLSATASASGQMTQSPWWYYTEVSAKSSCAPTALKAAMFMVELGSEYTRHPEKVDGTASLINHGSMETVTSYMTADILATIMGG